MAGYLIGEEGPLSGHTFSFEGEEEWTLGRDPDEASILLEDPMVSRKHAIARETSEGFFLENLSSVNPITQNGKVIEDTVLLKEGDILQIGSTFFRFSSVPKEEINNEENESFEIDDSSNLSSFRLDSSMHLRWMLKVISGPNAGAEFGMQTGATYILGKDPALCDIVFQDLSVSRQHARLSVSDEEKVFIEDLGSKNGVLVNGIQIVEKKELTTQDVIAVGTTSFLVLDKNEARETLISIPQMAPPVAEEQGTTLSSSQEATLSLKDWKEMVISKKALLTAGAISILIIGVLSMLMGLFNSKTITVNEKNEPEQIEQTVKNYPDIQFSFNASSGKLFIIGHVLTPVEKQELMYLLKTLPYIRSIDDNVVVDEYVWQNMNALLMTNTNWQGVSLYSPTPGKFVLRGYLQTPEQAGALSDYVNQNFPYLDRLDNQVVVENNLSMQISSLLLENGYSGVSFGLSNGNVVFQGAVDSTRSEEFTKFLEMVKTLRGVHSIKNYVVLSSKDSARIDLSSQYSITGSSKKDGTQNSVVINGKILTVGDNLDGMYISAIQSDTVLLEKDGLKFKINYNLQ